MILSVSQVKIVYLKGSRKSAKNAAKTWYICINSGKQNIIVSNAELDTS